jgi:hypothetical protein
MWEDEQSNWEPEGFTGRCNEGGQRTPAMRAKHLCSNWHMRKTELRHRTVERRTFRGDDQTLAQNAMLRRQHSTYL